MTKKSRQKFKNNENEKSFSSEIKSIFHHFKGLLVDENCLRSDSMPLTIYFKLKINHPTQFFKAKEIRPPSRPKYAESTTNPVTFSRF